MDATKHQSIMQGRIVSTLVFAAIFGGITYITEDAVDWSLVWIIEVMLSLLWFGHLSCRR